MIKSLPIVFMLALVLFISGCVQQPPEKSGTAFDSGLYTISRPSEWEVEEHEAFVYFRPPADNSVGTQGNVVIYVSPDESENQTLADFFQD